MCHAIVWAVKEDRQLFHGIPFIVVNDHQPLKNLESLATKVNRVERWFDFPSAYNYKLVYRSGRLNGIADLLSLLPLPGTNEETNSDLRLPNPTDIGVYFIPGRCQWSTAAVDVIFGAGEVEHTTAPRTTDEQAKLLWQVMRCDRDREMQQMTPPQKKVYYAIRDDCP